MGEKIAVQHCCRKAIMLEYSEIFARTIHCNPITRMRDIESRAQGMILPKFIIRNDFLPYADTILENGGKRKLFPANSRLSKATAEKKTAYYIEKGVAKLTLTTETGAENIIYFYAEGSIFPVNSSKTLFSLESSMNFIAITDLSVIAFPADQLSEMAYHYKNKDFVDAIVMHYASYASGVLTRIMLNSYNDSYKMVATFLYLLSHDINNKDRSIFLSQEDIGNVLGLSRIQVARVLKTLRESGIISTERKRIIILDHEALMDCCHDIVDTDDY